MNPTRVVGRRVVAYLADGFLAFLVFGTIVWFFDPQWTDPDSGELSPMASLSVVVLFLLYRVVVGVVLEGVWGWSPGKLLMGLRVVGSDGHPPGPIRALVRNLLWIVDGFCAGLVALAVASSNDAHKRIGDFVAGTYVIDEPYFGRMLVRTPDGVRAGAQTVRAEELGLTADELRTVVRPREPVYDKGLDTYVVWSDKQDRLLRFDKASGAWVPADG